MKASPGTVIELSLVVLGGDLIRTLSLSERMNM